MVNEKGGIQNKFPMNEQIQKQLTGKLFILWIVLLIVGAAGLLAYVVLGVFLENAKWVDAFLIFAVPFTLGLIFTLTVCRQNKLARNATDKSYECEFYSDCVIFMEFHGEERTGIVRINVGEIAKSKQSRDYMYFYYRGQIYPVAKAGFPEEELNAVKKLIKLPVEENAPLAVLPANISDDSLNGCI